MFLAVVSQPTHFLYTAAQKGVRSGQEGKQERGWLGRTRALQALPVRTQVDTKVGSAEAQRRAICHLGS